MKVYTIGGAGIASVGAGDGECEAGRGGVVNEEARVNGKNNVATPIPRSAIDRNHVGKIDDRESAHSVTAKNSYHVLACDPDETIAEYAQEKTTTRSGTMESLQKITTLLTCNERQSPVAGSAAQSAQETGSSTISKEQGKFNFNPRDMVLVDWSKKGYSGEWECVVFAVLPNNFYELFCTSDGHFYKEHGSIMRKRPFKKRHRGAGAKYSSNQRDNLEDSLDKAVRFRQALCILMTNC